MTEAFAVLRAALDSNEPAAILKASRQVSEATAEVRIHGAWRSDPVIKEKLSALMPLIEAARIRVNLSSDNVRQRIALLADYGQDGVQATYHR
ncbi:MAG: hypothetical protein ABI395_08995 [Sphingobium sp.]